MTLDIRPFMLAAVLFVPSACPVMAMEHREMMGNGSPDIAMEMDVGGDETFDPAMPMCCLGERSHDDAAAFREAVFPRAVGDEIIPLATACIVNLESVTDVHVPYDTTPPPPTFEERSVMRRE